MSNASRPYLAIIAFLACLPVAADYSFRMWSKGHYQYFVMLIAMLGYWTWLRKDEIACYATSPKPLHLGIMLSIGAFLLLASNLLSTSFVGALTLWYMSIVFAYWYWGLGGIRRIWPYWLVLLTIVPLPFLLDDKLTLAMQFWASNLASWILDAVGEIHFREGVVLIGQSRTFLTEEACSGIRSLFSSISLVALYGVIMRHPWWRNVFNLIQIVFWVLVGNAIRVAVVMYGVTHWTEELGTGWMHQGLGLVVLFFILGLGLSTDQMLNFVLRSKRREREKEEANHSADRQTKFGFQTTRPKFTIVLVIVLVAVFAVGARRTQVRFGSKRGLLASTVSMKEAAQQVVFPRLEGWQLDGYEVIDRGKESLMAEKSYAWKFRNGNLTAIVSLDGPYNGWHDLSICYRGLGWKTQLKQRFEATHRELFGAGHSELTMSKLSGEQGFILFATMDRNGDEVTPIFASGVVTPKAIWEQISINISATLGIDADSAAKLRGIPLPASGVQLACFPERELTEAEIRALVALFHDTRQQLSEFLKQP
jgi:exosortase